MAKQIPASELQAIARLMIEHADGNDEVARLLTLSVGRVLKNIAARGDQWASHYRPAEVSHIADWLRAALVNNEAWLTHTDAKDRPRKLMKFASIAQITQEANKAMAIAIQQQGQVTLVVGDEELYATTSDGFHLVRLKTPAALDRESAEMQHCVGHGAYDGWLNMSGYMVLSMRDRHGNAHATIEIENGRVTQIQGKQNQMPRRDYLESLVRYFVTENGKSFDMTPALMNWGAVMSAGSEIVNIHELPDGFESYSSLDFTEIRNAHIPLNLVVNGHLNLCETDSETLGPVSVRASLKIRSNSNIERIEGDINVGSSLILSSCEKLSSLPAGTKIPGMLRIWYCENLVELPRGMEVGELDLQHSSITKLPDDIKIGELLDISHSKIDKNELPAHLPDNLIVRTSVFEREKTLGEIRKEAKRRQRKDEEQSTVSPKM
ncbi:PcfJ domain-containing protein [Mesorhizobium sp. SP-1A]|uniref:PcfJ domain-containing protein n=1 Tax=Mesorhizobium sp. SP-1A TaxID=3077840 RepID=UPI0028F6E2A2|nr:PcfJ domain-containing protein [Mesorhizobium sp. SP-1A]